MIIYSNFADLNLIFYIFFEFFEFFLIMMI